jgi:hypothetical protein
LSQFGREKNHLAQAPLRSIVLPVSSKGKSRSVIEAQTAEFSTAQIAAAAGCSVVAASIAIRRLRAEGRIEIVPPATANANANCVRYRYHAAGGQPTDLIRTRFDVAIPEPIDYEALAAAYVAAKWKWGKPSFFPSADQLKAKITSLRTRDYYSSGGITWENGQILISRTLAFHYHSSASATPEPSKCL